MLSPSLDSLPYPKVFIFIMLFALSNLLVTAASREYKDSAEFRQFRREVFHASLRHILSSVHPHLTTPRITRCADGHYRRIIYCLGPYIADYPEQTLLACVVQGWCPRFESLAFSSFSNANATSNVLPHRIHWIHLLCGAHMSTLTLYFKDSRCENSGITMEL